MKDDVRKLRACIEWAFDHGADDDSEVAPWLFAFRSMLMALDDGRLVALTEKQRSWVHGVYEKVFDEPIYLNLVSAGRVPLGKPVELPEVLKKLPLKPPTRRVDSGD